MTTLRASIPAADACIIRRDPGRALSRPRHPRRRGTEALWRQEVDNPFPDQPEGAIVIDPDAANLHLILGGGRAMRYGVSVGVFGFGWHGDAVIQYGRKWPRWKAQAEMIARQPELAPYSATNGGMDPGPDNPLWTRAPYGDIPSTASIASASRNTRGRGASGCWIRT